MTLKVIAIMGEPGSGKSTLMKQFISLYEWELHEEVPLTPYLYNIKHRIIVLGKYPEGETFGGTDRMSMACQPEVIKFLDSLDADSNIVYEGDRLSNQSFLENCIEKFDTSVIYLEVSKEERERRYKERGSDQSETFLKGRITKYERLRTNFSIMMVTETFSHEKPEDTAKIIEHIQGLLQ